MSEKRASPTNHKPLFLLEVGLNWRLDTYVAARLEGLAARGLRVAAAVEPIAGETRPQLRDVELLDQPPWDEPRAQVLRGLLRDCARLALRSPRSLVGAIRAAKNPLRKPARGGVLAYARRLRRYLPLATLRPDVVQFTWNSPAIQYQPMTSVWRCPTVVSCYGSEVNVLPHLPGGAAFARALRASFAQATAVHCLSQSLATEAAMLGMDRGRTRVIPLGVDTSRFRPRHTRTKAATLKVVSVGQLRWMKGHEYSLRAIQQLMKFGVPVTLELIGGGPPAGLVEGSDRHRIERAVEELGLTGDVRLRGRLSPDEVGEALRGADVLLHMSVSEGLGVAVLEAMACGLPVVVADAGGPTEIVTNGVDGFVVPARKPIAAAAALRALYEDRALRERMGAAARSRIVERFSLDRELDAFAELYADLVTRPHDDRPACPPPDDIEPALAVASTGRELHLLSIGHWRWMEHYDTAMAAVRALVNGGTRCCYRIVGSGPCRDALWFERHQLGLERHVEIVDGVSFCHAQVDWADVLIDTDTSREALGYAHRRGVPVVAPLNEQALARDLSRAEPEGRMRPCARGNGVDEFV